MQYAIDGRILSIEAIDEVAINTAAALVDRLFLAPVWSPEPANVDVKLRIRTGTAPMVPAGLETFKVLNGVGHSDGKTFYLEIDDSLMVVDSSPSVDVWLSDGSPVSDAAVSVFWQSLAAALRRCHVFELHSSAVIPPGKTKAVLIVGPSGSGKSTLASQLAACGWSYLSDDRIFVYQDDEGLMSRPIRKFFALTTETVAALGLAHLSDTLPPTAKRRFDPESLGNGSQLDSARPATIVFPVISHEQQSTLRKITAPDSMARLLRISPWACYDKPTANQHLTVLRELAQRTTAYELLAGRDLMDDAGHSAQLISAAYADN
jgi:hypothetical protein